MAKDYVELIPQNLNFSRARLLDEDEQARYDEAVKSYNNEKAQKSLYVPAKGSNLFKVLKLNEIGIRTATTPELDLIVQNNTNFLRGTYEDGVEIVLRSRGDSFKQNDYLAKDIARKLKIRGSINTPLVVKGLGIKEDGNSHYGLSLVPTDGTQVIKAPDFSFKNNERKFKVINSDYTIEFEDDSSRIFYARQDGLSRLCLSRYLGLGSYNDSLANSDDDGRVVVVSTEGANPQRVKEYLDDLTKERQREEKELRDRFARAEKVLRGKK